MSLDTISWYLGCCNMAASMVFSAIAHHSKKIPDVGKTSMHRAVTIHQVASLGFLILATQYRHNETPLIPFSVLSVATVLFPGVIYYNVMSGTSSILSKLVPTGGMLHMLYWVCLCVYPPTGRK